MLNGGICVYLLPVKLVGKIIASTAYSRVENGANSSV